MKYLRYVLVLLLIPIIVWGERLIPQGQNTATIMQLSERITEPIPHRKVMLAREGKSFEAYLYETAQVYKVGEKVIFQTEGDTYTVSDKVRTGSILSLFALFLAGIVLVSGLQGVMSLLGLLFSFAIIFKFVLPQIVAGSNPIVVALTASILILTISYYLTHGINAKASIAIIGTLLSLVVTGILATIYGKLANLTGLGSEEAGFLIDALPRESFYQLFMAGIIIGSLGVLDDITISQAAIVEELKKANYKLGMGELYKRAMRIGHDHIGSVVNTLVLVYAGSALPLLVLFLTSQSGYLELLNYEMLSEEIVRTLVASIGLITAVPITTLLASYWHGGKR